MTHFECKCVGDVLMLYPVIRSPKNGWRFLYCPNMCVGPTLHRCSLGELGGWTSKKAGAWKCITVWSPVPVFFVVWLVLVDCISRSPVAAAGISAMSTTWCQVNLDSDFPLVQTKSIPESTALWRRSYKKWRMFTDVCDCLSHLVGHVLEQVTLCWPTPVAKWCPEGRRKLVLEVIFFGVSSVSTISTCFERLEKGWIKNKKKDTNFLKFLRFW